KKFYASATNRAEVSLRTLAKEIKEISTVSVPDTTAVIEALLQIIPRHLGAGAVVRLGEFGSFSVNVCSEGAASEDEFSSGLIKGKQSSC
ncbi:MAG: DNA-binding protein, partial [Calditrichaeota bacterium]